jgi:hypothetical protein
MKSMKRSCWMLCAWIVALFAGTPGAPGQVQRFPFHEGFENATGAGLPAGWSSSRRRNGTADDFSISSSSPRSGSGCLLAVNATIPQELLSPVFDCTGLVPSVVEFSLKRSSTFASPVVVEASVDSGTTFPYRVGDTLVAGGASGYVTCRLTLIAACEGCPVLRLRWRTLPTPSGTSATLRFDDFLLRVVRPPGDERMVINEIMYEPFAAEPEFIELRNAGHDSVWLSGWEISDRPGSTGHATAFTFPDLQDPLPPDGFIVVASDSSGRLSAPAASPVQVAGSSWPSLNNDGDDIVLRNGTGRVIDSVSYLPAWHTPTIPDRRGRSLERVRAGLPSNVATTWETCVSPEGSTPGRENSVSLVPASASGVLLCSPNPFSPDTDGRDDATLIRYQLPEGGWRVGLTIYDVRGRLVRNLCGNMPAVAEGSIAWDGRDNLRRRVRVGRYVVVLEAWESGGVRSVSARCVAVVGRR